jgi:hypothetical protein
VIAEGGSIPLHWVDWGVVLMLIHEDDLEFAPGPSRNEIGLLSGWIRSTEHSKKLAPAGIAAGIDMALRLVSQLHGETVAAWSAQLIEYAYWPQAQRAAQGVVSTLKD